MARRGIVVLSIDAIVRGNSGNPGDIDDACFDETFGGKSALEYLRALPFVEPRSVGMMGHNLGAEMACKVSLGDPEVNGPLSLVSPTPRKPHRPSRRTC